MSTLLAKEDQRISWGSDLDQYSNLHTSSSFFSTKGLVAWKEVAENFFLYFPLHLGTQPQRLGSWWLLISAGNPGQVGLCS